MHTMKQALRDLLAAGKTAKVIDQLRKLVANDTDLSNEVTMLSARFKNNEREKHLNTGDPDLLGIEHNRINSALLDVIERWDGTSRSQLRSIALYGGVLAGLLIVVFLVLRMGGLADNKPFSVVVYTHGEGGRQNIVQLKETKLVVDFGGDRKVATVGENGQNTFNEVASKFRNTNIGIGLQGTEGYALRFPDSTYLLNGQPIYLEVKSVCQTCVIEGFVQNQTQFLPNYVVSTGIFSDTTDAKGYFKIMVSPEKAMKADYPVTVLFKGKIIKQLLITPDPKKPAEILID